MTNERGIAPIYGWRGVKSYLISEKRSDSVGSAEMRALSPGFGRAARGARQAAKPAGNLGQATRHRRYCLRQARRGGLGRATLRRTKARIAFAHNTPTTS